MKELLETIARALVTQPDQVFVSERETENALVLELTVAKDDMGKVIGRQGRIARAIRSVIKAASVDYDKKVMVEIL